MALLKLQLKCFMDIYGQKFKTKGVESIKKSKINYHSLLKLSDEYATFDNKKG